MSNNIKFEKVGGSYQPIVHTAEDLKKLLKLPPALWTITSISTDAVAIDPEFLTFIDYDENCKVRVDEVKTAISWMLERLKNFDNAEKGSDILCFDALNEENPEAVKILASAKLALFNTGKADANEISLTEIRDRKKIIAAGLTNGDGVIPPGLIEQPELSAIAQLVMDSFGKTQDVSGLDGFNDAALDTFEKTAAAYILWNDEQDSNATVVYPNGTDTAKCYNALMAVKDTLDQYFVQCRAFRLFGTKAEFNATAPNAMNIEDVAAALQKAPIACPNKECNFSIDADLNPLWRDKVQLFFDLCVKDKRELTEEEWNAIKAVYAPYAAWLARKPTDLFDKFDLATLKKAMEDHVADKLRALLKEDLRHADEINCFNEVQKLILYQQNLIPFLNNYVNLRILFDSTKTSILQAGTLVMDGRCFHMATRVTSIADHKKIATRSNICTMYIVAQTGQPKALKTLQLAVAVTSGDMYNLFVGKYGIFYTHDGLAWDAKVVDFILQPVSISEALQMPFIRFGALIGKQLDKFFSARSKEVETGLDKTFTQAQKFDPKQLKAPAAKQQTPAVSGSMMLMGGGVGLAAIGSAVAFMAQTLKNVSIWSVLLIFVCILLLFGGPMIISSLVKLYRRNIAVFMEASGLAMNKRMRLTRLMGKLFTEKPKIPHEDMINRMDAVRTIFLQELEKQNTEKTPSPAAKIFYILLSILIGIGIGTALWYFCLR